MYHVSRRGGACPRLAVGSCNFNPSAGESAQGSAYRCREVVARLRAINDRPYERVGRWL